MLHRLQERFALSGSLRACEISEREGCRFNKQFLKFKIYYVYIIHTEL